MHAHIGDHIVVRGKHVGERDREGEVVAVTGVEDPPFTVRWSADGHEGLVWPGPDVLITPREPATAQ